MAFTKKKNHDSFKKGINGGNFSFFYTVLPESDKEKKKKKPKKKKN